MKSTPCQLLIALAAVVVSASFFASRGLPPSGFFSNAMLHYDRDEIIRHLQWGGNPDAFAYHGTVMQYAISRHDLDMVMLLIERGANVNTMSGIPGTSAHICWTPLSFAKDLKQDDIVEVLRSHGAREEVFDLRTIP